MPLYAYRCTKCGHKFEKIQSFSAEPERKCPKCDGPVERPLTAPRLQFKGAGWYVNDYASKSSEAAGDSTKPAAPSESKTPTTGSDNAAKTESATQSTSASDSAPTTPAKD